MTIFLLVLQGGKLLPVKVYTETQINIKFQDKKVKQQNTFFSIRI